MRSHESSIRSMVSSTKGALVSGGHDRVILVWDPNEIVSNDFSSTRPSEVLRGHTGYVLCLEIRETNDPKNPYGISTIVSASTDRICLVWEYTPSGFVRKHVLTGHEGQIYSLEFDPIRNRIMTGSYDKSVRIWDEKEGVCLSVLPHSGVISCMRYDQKRAILISTTNDTTVNFWDIKLCKLIHSSNGGHRGYVLCIDLNDDIAITGGQDGILVIWNFKDLAERENPSYSYSLGLLCPLGVLAVGVIVGLCRGKKT